MSLLHAVEEDVATGVVKEVYDEVTRMFGSVPAGLKLWSLKPDALHHHWEGIKKNLVSDMEVQKFNTILRYLISEIEGCEFCIGFNAGLLINMFGMTQDALIAMAKEPETAPLSEKHRALLLFALKVVKESKGVESKDIEQLKVLGITENEIFDVALSATNMLVSDMLLNAFKVQN